jgi:hypothetical protein
MKEMSQLKKFSFKKTTHNFTLRTKVTRMYFFILHLSIADILTAFFTLLVSVL